MLNKSQKLSICVSSLDTCYCYSKILRPSKSLLKDSQPFPLYIKFAFMSADRTVGGGIATKQNNPTA